MTENKTTYNATLMGRTDFAEGLTAFQVAADKGPVDFVSGQYNVLGLLGSAPRHSSCEPDPKPVAPDQLIRRAYSIASSPHNKNYLEFLINVVPQGSLAPRLFVLKKGDRLFVGPKAVGHFTLDGVPQDQHVVLISTGTGLGPFMSMAREEAELKTGRKIILVHGARTPMELAYREEITQLSKSNSNIIYIPSISRPAESNWKGLVGRIPKLLEEKKIEEAIGETLTPQKFHVYLCGNPDMITAMKEMLAARDFTPWVRASATGNIHTEAYW